ncbi:hypothetical protein ACLOJK_021088 [Asimina triloba]
MAVWLKRRRVFALRRRMEAKGGEVRRVHVVYFLSRMGRIEHPHLIRVHHMSRTGVRLRGFSVFTAVPVFFRWEIRHVKRWLGDLRGKDMPDSFSWSYKRRYKTGYVWQDLLDDDLITPIADNEYVLKGSEISTLTFDSCVYAEKASALVRKLEEENGEKVPETKVELEDPPSQIDGRLDDPPPLERTVEGGEEGDEEEEEAEKGRGSTTFGRSKSHASGSSHVFFRNLLTCKAVETDDSAMVAVDRRRKQPQEGREICKVDVSGGPRGGRYPQPNFGR